VIVMPTSFKEEARRKEAAHDKADDLIRKWLEETETKTKNKEQQTDEDTQPVR
jgi:hypothetical protein